MRLESLSISTGYYPKDNGQYRGTVRFSDQLGSIEIHLDGNLSQKVLEVVAESLVDQAKKTGSLIAGKVITQVREPEKLPEA